MKKELALAAALLAFAIIYGCEKKNQPAPSQPSPPVADFTFEITNHITRTVDFTNASTRADSYSWQFGDAGTSTAVSPQHSYPGYATYTVTLTAYGQGGPNTATKSVTVTP